MAIESRQERLVRASEILSNYLDKTSETLLRVSMQNGCAEEVKILILEVIKWLADDDYYFEMAYDIEQSNPSGEELLDP